MAHHQEGTENRELLSEELSVHTPHQAPQLLKPAPERGAPTTTSLKSSGDYAHETCGAVGELRHSSLS